MELENEENIELFLRIRAAITPRSWQSALPRDIGAKE
jgi:hypothetical protein